MIDLHTHTTASDGKCSPGELVARAAAAGVTTLGLTDHDTTSGCAAADAACARHGLRFVPGIEITAVADERDVHVLAYFFDLESDALHTFLAEQRLRRVERVREMFARLEAVGIHLDAEAILGPGLEDSTRAVGRPWIARALVEAGYVASVGEAFDTLLSRGCSAFVPRIGANPEDVFAKIHEAGGIASLAHPVLVKHDEWIPAFAAAGLDALEAFHSDHDEADTARYLGLARDLNLLVTGGSDYHADDEHGGGGPGSVSLPRAYFEQLEAARPARR
ncbi:MAG: PHP domain-containing protein [Vicinamibacterales bacterium]